MLVVAYNFPNDVLDFKVVIVFIRKVGTTIIIRALIELNLEGILKNIKEGVRYTF